MKTCPYCAEDIQDAAIVCKHCGRPLTPDAAAIPSPIGHPIYSTASSQPTVNRSWSPGVAAVLSFLIPGLGQIYKGRVGLGIVFFLCTGVGYLCFIVPGLILHLVAVINAASGPAASVPTAPSPAPPVKAIQTAIANDRSPEQVARDKRTVKGLAVVFGVIVALVIVSSILDWTHGRTSTSTPVATAAAPVAEPDEPCVIDAPAAAHDAAAKWCHGGIFKNVTLSTDARNFVAMLVFSKKGKQAWDASSTRFLEGIRSSTDEIGTSTRLNVAYSFFNPEGILIGGCARRAKAAVSTCSSQ